MAKTIIYADDSVTMRKVGEITFAGSPYEALLLAGGADVVAKAKESHPAVIILDTEMPDLDGYEACRQIRGDGSLSDVPVLLMAGPSTPIDEQKASDVGASAHMVKPFETQAMLDKVEALASAGGAPAMEPPPKPAPAPRPVASGASAKTVIGLGAMGHAPGAAKPPPKPPAKPAPKPAAKPAPKPAAKPVAAAAPPARPKAAPPAAPPAAAKPAPRAKTHEMTPDEVRMIEGIAREVVEQVVWEVVPDLAETIIREELAKLLKE